MRTNEFLNELDFLDDLGMEELDSSKLINVTGGSVASRTRWTNLWSGISSIHNAIFGN